MTFQTPAGKKSFFKTTVARLNRSVVRAGGNRRNTNAKSAGKVFYGTCFYLGIMIAKKYIRVRVLII